MALLITEGFFTAALWRVNDNGRLWVVGIMAGVFLIIIVIVTIIVFSRPQNLSNYRLTQRVEELGTNLEAAYHQLADLQTVIKGEPFKNGVYDLLEEDLTSIEDRLKRLEERGRLTTATIPTHYPLGISRAIVQYYSLVVHPGSSL